MNFKPIGRDEFIKNVQNNFSSGYLTLISIIQGVAFETEVSSFRLRHEVHNSGDQGISSGVAGQLAIDTETLAAEVLGE